jgi:Transposase DDE domain
MVNRVAMRTKKRDNPFKETKNHSERIVLLMNHTSSHHRSAQSSGLLSSQSALVAWLEEQVHLLFPTSSQTEPVGRGRPAQLTLPHLCLALFLGVFTGATGFCDIWRWLVVEPLGSFPALLITDEAVRKALKRWGPDTFGHLYLHLCDLLPQVKLSQSTTGLACFAREIVALDASTLDAVHRHRKQLRHLDPTGSALLAGKIAGLWDVRRQRWFRLQFRADAQAHCATDLYSLIQGLPVGSLILQDLGYFGFPWLDWLHDAGYFSISRLKEKVSYQILHTFIQDESQGYLDAVVFLGTHRSDQAAHAVRLIQFRRGATTYRYLTNVLDPQELPFHEIVQLDARRWDIELLFLLLKEHFGLHQWWSSKPDLMLCQLWIALMATHLLTRLRFQIASHAQVSSFDVSVAVLLDLLRRLSHPDCSLAFLLAQRGRFLKLIRPHSRLHLHIPIILLDTITPLPPDLRLLRTPHYAHRNHHPRHTQYTPLFSDQLLI